METKDDLFNKVIHSEKIISYGVSKICCDDGTILYHLTWDDFSVCPHEAYFDWYSDLLMFLTHQLQK